MLETPNVFVHVVLGQLVVLEHELAGENTASIHLGYFPIFQTCLQIRVLPPINNLEKPENIALLKS
jgi:hypothetical protein